MIKKILLLMLIAMFSTPARAGSKSVLDFSKDWGGRAFAYTCESHNITNSETLIIDSKRVLGSNTDARHGHGYQIMAAMEVTDKGAYFCPMIVYAWGEWKGDTNTRYGKYGDDSACVWLCKSGYTGEKCEVASNGGTVATSCDLEELHQSDYKTKLAGVGFGEIESSVAMFYMNKYTSCGYNTDMEHDMILAITKFLPSGHGAFVDQLIVGSYRNGWRSDQDHYITLNTDKNPVLVCKNGYTANAAGDDCVEIDSAICDLSRCERVADDFNAEIHKVVTYSEEKRASGELKGTCKFRCAEPGYAFASNTSKACVECPRELRQGVSSYTGTCIKCLDNQIYDVVLGDCVDGMQLLYTDLLYGVNKITANSEEPCWMKNTSEDYINCIMGK